MQNDKMDSSAVYTMFEEIKENQAKQLTAIERLQSQPDPMSAEVAPTLTTEDGEKIEVLTEKLDTVSEKLNLPLKHHHTIDFMGNWALIALVLMVGAFIASLWVINNQRRTISRFRDNDLKYRYVKMHDGATAGEIKALETIFTYDRNPDSIKIIHRQVIQYERLVKEQADKTEQAKLNASEAERLRKEVETVKGRK
jgi:HAMP domain-containing protein